MELISREEIKELTKIGPSQFKSFRRLGLIEGYVKKTSIVKLDKKKTREQGNDVYVPAGFTYHYPRSVLNQIKWIEEHRQQGKNLMEIQNEFIRNKIQKEEEVKSRSRIYERTRDIPEGALFEKGIRDKFVGNAIRELTEQIRLDNADREVRTLVFLVETERDPSAGSLITRMTVKLDIENSQF